MKVKEQGFTFVELLIALTIVGILSSIAYPHYVQYIQKAKRAQAQATLLSLASAMEQWRLENNNEYTNATLGAGATAIFANQVPSNSSATKTYLLSVVADKTTYTLTATPVPPQDADECGVLTLNSTGVKVAKGATPNTQYCWE
jgi:type IV pilus assembly protein PilE